jgi:putative nucleotidyltransferase with HDIG domain
MMAGILTVFSVITLRRRSQLFVSALIIFGVYTAVYLAIGLIQEGNIADTNWEFLSWFFISALLTLFTYPLVYLFEKIFGFVSDVTLMELADTNSKLLRKLNEKAPGTFQHSMQVSNLAEEAIRAVGGNALLVRAGALYHDIGKMNMPNYFIENQNSDYNPHDELPPEESSKIIIEHVILGIEMARRYKLPDILIDFIRTHHGTTKTQYFLRKYKEEHPDEEIDERKFQYPGPIPYSKETAILMMADSVEAASRSLSSYDGKGIENLIDNIIDNQIKEEQFAMANITFRDITTIKKIFKKKLMSIYHVRVEYPD